MTILHPGCKINLGLRVLSRRADGYHDIESVFLPLASPCDELLIKKTQGRFSLECNVAIGKANTLAKAYRLFQEECSSAPGADIQLIKKIPMGAGLGGGSSDAAAFLIWLNEHSSQPLEPERLLALAARVGADTPFFLINRPAYIAGIGDIIEPFKGFSQPFWIVLVWPGVHSDTSQAFKMLDMRREGKLENGLTKICQADKKSLAENGVATIPDCRNDLETPVFSLFPLLAGLKRFFRRSGAIRAAMSGSGSAIYGIFEAPEIAQKAAKSLRQKYRHTYFLVCKSANG